MQEVADIEDGEEPARPGRNEARFLEASLRAPLFVLPTILSIVAIT